MKKPVLYILLLTLLALPTGQAQASDRVFWSTAVGAAMGGYVGSTIGKGRGNLAATAAGTFLGGAVGNSVGHSVDRANRGSYASQQVLYYAQPPLPYRPNYVAPIMSEEPDLAYRDPSYEHYYATPPRLKRVERAYGDEYPRHTRRGGRHCREFTQTVRIDGEVQESYGVACLRPDGSWQVQ